jgi:hypothetical protein
MASKPTARERKRAKKRLQECTRKEAWETKDDAQAQRDSLTLMGEQRLHSYLCGWCGKYHVGHRRSRRK